MRTHIIETTLRTFSCRIPAADIRKVGRCELETDISTVELRAGNGNCDSVPHPVEGGADVLACHLYRVCLLHFQTDGKALFPRSASWPGKLCVDHSFAHTVFQSVHCQPPAGSGDDEFDAVAGFSESDDGPDRAGCGSRLRCGHGSIRIGCPQALKTPRP